MSGRKTEALSEKRSILYEIARGLAQVLFHTLMPVRFANREHLDQEPPFLLIANHRSWLDPLAMALGFPKKQLVFLGKAELGANPVTRWIMTRLHCILVDRHKADMEAMRACMKAVKAGRILLIFPEGTRHHEGQMEQIESGTALIALRSRVPIIPIYIDRKLGFFRRTTLYAGAPIPCDDLLEKGINTETCEMLNERLRETFRKMIREAEKPSAEKK